MLHAEKTTEVVFLFVMVDTEMLPTTQITEVAVVYHHDGDALTPPHVLIITKGLSPITYVLYGFTYGLPKSERNIAYCVHARWSLLHIIGEKILNTYNF